MKFITTKTLWKLFKMNISKKPFNHLSLGDFFDLDDIIKRSNKDNIITSIIQILSILLNEDEDTIREFKLNPFTSYLLNKWILILFKDIKYEEIDFTNSKFSDFIDNDKLLQMGKKYEAIETICRRNNINTNKAEDCLMFYFSYTEYCYSLKKKFSGVFISKEDDEVEEDNDSSFSSSQNKAKEQMRSNWLWYDILDEIAQGDITKYDEILEMPVDKVLTKIAHIRYKNELNK